MLAAAAPTTAAGRGRRPAAMRETGGVIILGATPIGNLGDASTRLRDALSTATVIAAEDTRTAIHLMRALDIDNRPRLIALHDHNERERAGDLVALAAEEDILVLSDAGMPTVSDPGYHLVQAAIEADVRVTALPGPSAVLMALAVSGEPTDRFAFEGFLPRKPGDRRATLRGLATEERTLVFFESPARLASSLADIATVFGADRHLAVCRELTKLYEEVRRGPAAELALWAAEGVKGEIVIVVRGAAPAVIDADAALVDVLALVAEGVTLKDATAAVAARTGSSKRDLYEAALAARRA
jgi:16S rRNA (cytidine1402-2'-O)-methyltransferase